MIISLRDITLSHSSIPLVQNANLHIENKDRVVLIGRNGAGKSTLLRLINDEIEPDYGVLEKAKSLKCALLPQAVPSSIPGTVRDIVCKQLEKTEEYWADLSMADKVISKLQLHGEAVFNDLSGGMKRLVLLASILVQDPDVLLLDEPTNHLDIDKIELLENLLLSFQKTIIFVTHDRVLLQKLANHIVEIDNGKLISWRGNYDQYLKHKDMLYEAEVKANALFDKKLAQEEQWIRQGIKARRTRNEGRVRMLKKMREEKLQRRVRQGTVNLGQTAFETSGKIVFDIENINFSFKNKIVVKDFSTIIQRGDKIGIIGANGVGKTTLINLILGNLPPSAGQVKSGTNLTIGYFDQHRLQLNDELSILDSLSEVGNTITIGNKEKHLISYLQDFLFSPSQAKTPIKNLSGGERNRVMLAKLFSKPCNVLVLDEPTNDLDVETLELLEEKLLEYTGTLLLISHDRSFLNNVVTSTLVFEGNGRIQEYIGGYDDYLRQESSKELSDDLPKKDDKNKSKDKTSLKLSLKEKKELELMPSKIEELEKRQHQINEMLADPEYYKNHSDQAVLLKQELDGIETQLTIFFDRWEELEKKNQNN